MKKISTVYDDALRIAIVSQVAVTMLLLTLLDGGTLAKVGAAAMAGFWTGAALIMSRRPRWPSTIDLLFVRWGYVPLLIVAAAMTPWMGVLRR